MAASKAKAKIEIVQMKPMVRSVWESIGITKSQAWIIGVLLFAGLCALIFSSVDIGNHSDDIEWEFKELETAPVVEPVVLQTQSSSGGNSIADRNEQIFHVISMLPLIVAILVVGTMVLSILGTYRS